jgi:hypothetical protein
MPSEWPTVTAATIGIKDKAGEVLVAATAATIAAADVTTASVSKGDESCILSTGGTWKNGDLVRIGSDAIGWQNTIVESYVSGTKTLSIQDFFDHEFPIGVAVQHRVMTYDLDTDTDDEWDSIGNAYVTWTPDADVLPFREKYAVLDKKAASSGLEQKFSIAYGRYMEEIQPEHFVDFETRARSRISILWEGRGRDINKLVDNELLDDLLMLQIAILIAVSKGDEYDKELIKLKLEMKEQISLIDDLPIWFDDNEDDVQTEDEYQPSMQAGLNRGL